MHGDGDGWVTCAQGHEHWGLHGAAGVLLRDPDDAVLLQHRVGWSHHGHTWGIPGGARDSGETPEHAALREAGEEAGLDPRDVTLTGLLVDDHGGWSYTTVLACAEGRPEVTATGRESLEVAWVPTAGVATLPLHPGFVVTWPRLARAPRRPVLVVNAVDVLRTRTDGRERSRPAAARRLRDRLGQLPVTGVPADRLGLRGCDLVLPDVVLVVEGMARAVAAEPAPPRVRVVAAPGPGAEEVARHARDGAVVPDPELLLGVLPDA
jgi:8-oxo-dGTP diphosphatase